MSSTPQQQPSQSRSITRRGFLKASATTAAGGASLAGALSAISVLPGCSHQASEQTSDPVVLEEDAAKLFSEDFTESDQSIDATNTWHIPLGNILYPAEGAWIPAITAGTSATPMVVGSVFNTQTGTINTVLDKPQGSQTTTVIYDVRCSDQVYAWVELDITTRAWVLYAVPFSGEKLSDQVTKLWEADANYDPARMLVSGASVIWIVQPALSGSKTAENSVCYLWRLGQQQAQAAVESAGRFGTEPSLSKGKVILTPRVNTGRNVYYGITSYDLANDMQTKLEQLVLPQSIRPLRATMVGDRFMFSIEASYSSGGLFGQMGTYIGSESQGFTRVDREPSEIACGTGDRFVVKSRARYLVLNVADNTYTSISAVDHSLDFGEYPARSGDSSQLLTFSTVKDQKSGYPTEVVVRSFLL